MNLRKFVRRVSNSIAGRDYFKEGTFYFEQLQKLLLGFHPETNSRWSSVEGRMTWSHYRYDYGWRRVTTDEALTFIQKFSPEKGYAKINHERYYGGMSERHYVGLIKGYGTEKNTQSVMTANLEFLLKR